LARDTLKSLREEISQLEATLEEMRAPEASFVVELLALAAGYGDSWVLPAELHERADQIAQAYFSGSLLPVSEPPVFQQEAVYVRWAQQRQIPSKGAVFAGMISKNPSAEALRLVAHTVCTKEERDETLAVRPRLVADFWG
jgi:hypothetical protein